MLQSFLSRHFVSGNPKNDCVGSRVRKEVQTALAAGAVRDITQGCFGRFRAARQFPDHLHRRGGPVAQIGHFEPDVPALTRTGYRRRFENEVRRSFAFAGGEPVYTITPNTAASAEAPRLRSIPEPAYYSRVSPRQSYKINFDADAPSAAGNANTHVVLTALVTSIPSVAPNVQRI